jgi:cytidylate kinase
MQCSAERLIEALIGIDLARERKAAEQHAEQARRASYVVTVSRGYGSLGREVAQELAARLGVDLCDRSILEAVAARAAVDVELIHKLDETVRHAGLKPWKQLFNPVALTDLGFHNHLVTVIMNISKKGGVILGRGAHLVLGPGHAFRVRIVGSLEECAHRIVGREDIDLASARERVQEVDREREAYLQQYFHISSSDESVHDLVFNSDRFSVAEMVELILRAMRIAGYDITEAMLHQP